MAMVITYSKKSEPQDPRDPRTPKKPEYLIVRSHLTERGPLGRSHSIFEGLISQYVCNFLATTPKLHDFF